MSHVWLDSFLQDLRYGVRMLVKAPVFASIAVLTLALGIGANTAIFSVVNGVLLNPLPFPESQQLVSLFEKIPNFNNGSISYPNFLDWQRMNTTFTGMAAYRSAGFNLTGDAEPEHLHGEMISAGFFEILGVQPLMGRTFTREEDRVGANPTVMVTEGLWRRRFGASPDIIGRKLILNDEVRTVVGVIPSSFHLRIQNFQRGEAPIDVYVPVGEYNEPQFYSKRNAGWGLDGIGRIKPGVTFEQARADMERVSRDLAATYPDIDTARQARLVPLKDEIVDNMRPVLLVLFGAVGFVLLIACVNVANLLLARSTSRQHEFAIRIALGAGQTRIIRQLLTESVLLAIIGGALGLLLAKFGTAAAIAAAPRGVPRAEEIGLDGRVLIFTLLVSLLTGVVFGLAPAWKTARADVGGTLKEAGRTMAGIRSHTQTVFVVGEMAMALVLLVGAGLMVRTLVRLWNLDPGFNPRNVVTFSLAGPASFKDAPADSIRSTYRQLHEKLVSTPGVEAASFSWGAHPMQGDDEEPFWIAGRPRPPRQSDLPMALQYVVEPDYFKAMQIQLKRGRLFSSSDAEHTPAVVVIDESFAAKFFPGEDPIGKFLDFNNDPSNAEKVPNAQIVGVVAHVNQWGLDSDASFPLHAQMYLPFSQIPDKQLKQGGIAGDVFVRTQQHGNPSFQTMRHRMLEISSGIVLFAPEDMQQTVANSISSKRFTMALLGVFAGLALLLASIGIYGVLSYLVGQRTQEIGVRMALGAQPADVLRMVLRDGARMTLLGVGIGVIAALLLTRLMTSLLFGVSPNDPLTFVAVAASLCLVSLIACYVPARRAMGVNPIIALRYQ
jgi:predicted permease